MYKSATKTFIFQAAASWTVLNHLINNDYFGKELFTQTDGGQMAELKRPMVLLHSTVILK